MGGRRGKRPLLRKIVDETIYLTRPRHGAVLKEEVWQAADGSIVKYSLAYLNPKVSGADNGRVLGYDNTHNCHHRHSWDGKPHSISSVTKHWRLGFTLKCASFGGRKMKSGTEIRKPAPGVSVSTGSVDAYIERSLNRARKLDRAEHLPPQIAVTFANPADLLRVVSAERVRLLRAVRAKPAAVSELAAILGRDRKAVSRDVSLLESFGLLRSREETNPGHGRRRIVEPRAARYHLIATI